MEPGKSTMLDNVGVSKPSGGSTQDKVASPESFPIGNKKVTSAVESIYNKNKSVAEKLNGELDSSEKNSKKNCLAKPQNRARSRSKSPRGKSPDKKETNLKNSNRKKDSHESNVENTKKDLPEKKSSKGKSPDKKEGVKSPEKKSPAKNKKAQKSPNKQSSSDKNNEQKETNISSGENKVSNTSVPKKQAKKRKVSQEPTNTAKSEPKSAPKPKKPKKEAEESSNKPKRKYVKKPKKGETNNTSDKVETSTSKTADSEPKKEFTEDASQSSNSKGEVLQNGSLSEKEAKLLPAPTVPNFKKVTKKGTAKKPPKPEVSLPLLQQVNSKSLSGDANHGTGEPEDSDTMDYSVNNGGVNITDNLVEKKVVKIDDIEITELSDLNSSRESGDENDLDHCVVEKPQALNDSISSPQSESTPISSAAVAKETDDKLFVCEQQGCKYRGKSRVLLRKHLTHHGIYHCAHCEFLGHQYHDLEMHMVANHPQRWGRKKCKKCTRYIRGDEFEIHDQTCEGKKMFSCEICGKEFKYESLAKDHEKKMHRAHNCQFCDFIGDTKQILSHHMSQVHPKKKPDKHKCKQCEGLFPSKKLLSEHVKSVHGTVSKVDTENNNATSQSASTDIDQITAETPEMEFQSLPIVKEESVSLPNALPVLESYDDPNAKIQTNFTLNPVQQTTSSVETDVNTVSANFNCETADRIPVESIPQGSPPPILIQVPGITAPVKPSNSESMLNTSFGSTELKSDIAASAPPSVLEPSVPPAIQSQSVVVPKNIMEERPFACEKCPKRFKDQKTLNGHKHVHSKELNFKCDVNECGLAFKTARLLNFHKKTVHEVAPGVPMHPCEHPDCHLVFKKKGQLKKHEVVHTGERRYICEWPNCGKAFRHNANLKIHHLLHTGEKPIKCKYCDFACRQKSSLIHHMKTKHKEIGWPLPKKDLQDQPSAQQQEPPINNGMDDGNSHDDSKSDLDSSTDRLSETDISGNTEPPKLEGAEPPIYPKMLSTPTKAMVKAMAPGFRLNTPGFEKMKSISPISSTAPPLLNKPCHTDVYDFNEDDTDNDSGIPVSLSKKHDKGQVKSPGRPVVPASSLELLQAMEPMNLSSDQKPVPEEVTVVKKKRASPKKKKAEQQSIDSSRSDICDTSLDTSMDTSIDHGGDTSMDTSIDHGGDTSKEEELNDIKDTSETSPDDEPPAQYLDSDSGVKSQESQDHGSSVDMVEEHVSENLPLSATSSESAAPPQNEDVINEEEMEPQEPVAVPSQPEPYPDPAPPILHSEEQPPSAELEQTHDEASNQDEVYHEQSHSAMDDSTVSDIPPDVEELALHRSVAPGSPGLLDMHLPEKRDGSFDLPHDIDPDEAAKLLEESDSFHEDPKNSSGSHEVPVIMSNTQSSKEDYLPPSPSSHNNSNIHHDGEQGDINNEQFDYNSYGQHHPGDFDQIHDLSSHEKERTETENYADPSQRRPSSSYVPDFLPTMATTSAGSSGMGPPSVSSSYSSPSYSVPSQSQADLPAYGAPGSNLPQYPPQSSSVPYLSPSSTHNTYPTTTSAGSGISSYPAITTTSFTESQSSERVPSADTRTASYRDSETTTVTSSSSYPGSTYQSSRDIFGHYFQDPNLPLPHIASQQDPRSLTYPPQQSSLQALQRSSADFLQRASATGLPGMNYPSVTESLARLSQTSSQQPWIGHDERSRPWAQASPIIMPPELDSTSALNRNPFSSTRPEYNSLESAAKRPDSAFPSVPSQSVPSATDRYDVASAYMGSAGHFNPSSNYTKTLPPSVPAPTKQLEEAYRHSAASHMSDYRSLSQAPPPPSVTDMYSRMGMNPTLGLEKYYPYSRDAVYRSQHIGTTPNPFMPQTSTAQVSYADRDYAARNPYAQDSAYSKYLQPANLTQPLPGLQAAPADYFQARPGAPDPYDPYRRSVIHNMMTRYF